MKYLLDTSAVNRLLDGQLSMEDLPEESEFFITHLQVDEINNTSDSDRRARLSLFQHTLRPKVIPTETLVFDVSRFDHAKLSNGALYRELLDSLDTRGGRRVNKIRDALIAETALKQGLCLITADESLADVAELHGGEVLRVAPK